MFFFWLRLVLACLATESSPLETSGGSVKKLSSQRLCKTPTKQPHHKLKAMATKQLKDYLDNLVDEEGIKSEVTITLTNETLVKTAGTLFLTGTAITVMVFMIKGIAHNLKKTP